MKHTDTGAYRVSDEQATREAQEYASSKPRWWLEEIDRRQRAKFNKAVFDYCTAASRYTMAAVLRRLHEERDEARRNELESGGLHYTYLRQSMDSIIEDLITPECGYDPEEVAAAVTRGKTYASATRAE